MDEQARRRAPLLDLVDDPVERHLAVGEGAPEVHREHEERGRHPARHRDLRLQELLARERLGRDDDGAVPRAHARAVRQEDVAVLDERVGVERERAHLEPPLERPLVQGLDVAEHVLELEVPGFDEPLRERPEHERVVGIRAVSEADQHGGAG